MVITNDITEYSMVIFPAAFIFSAYEGDPALNHMLAWYKVISVIIQSKFLGIIFVKIIKYTFLKILYSHYLSRCCHDFVKISTFKLLP